MKITKAQNAANAAKTADLFQAEAAELLELLGRKVNVLAEQAKADGANGKANWGTVGSLGFVIDQLLSTVEGFELPAEDKATVAQIRNIHENNWS